jgi:hypothetical protein
LLPVFLAKFWQSFQSSLPVTAEVVALKLLAGRILPPIMLTQKLLQ